MDSAERQRLAGKLLGLAKALRPLGPGPVRIEFGDFGLDTNGVAQLDETRNWLLRQNGWGSKYSEKYLTTALAKAVTPLQTSVD